MGDFLACTSSLGVKFGEQDSCLEVQAVTDGELQAEL